MKILINGSTGAMGKTLIEMIDGSDELELAAGVSKDITGDESYPAFSNFEQINVDYDVIIDFSHYTVTDTLIAYAIKMNKPVVLATTGLSAEQEANVVIASESVPIFRAKNFSLGVNLIAHLIKSAQEVLKDYDIEIIEKHHNRKTDAPSGTAFFLADALNENHDYTYKYGREGNQAKREKNEIGIHAVRGGTIVGEHSVIFAGTDEIIEVNHAAHSKKVFANGAIKAAVFINNQKNGLYNMNDIMPRRI